MKRFWTEASRVQISGGWRIELDRKPLRTPAQSELVLASERLAEAISREWSEAGAIFEPQGMPMTGLANAAIDRVSKDPSDFARGLANYAEADLLCYRAESPAKLVKRQSEAWDPLLEWARQKFGIDFRITRGIMHVAQARATIESLGRKLDQFDNFELAGLSPLVTIGGSLVAALAIIENAVSPATGWDAVSVDDRWQIESWGEDAEAVEMLFGRRRDFLAAGRFLELL